MGFNLDDYYLNAGRLGAGFAGGVVHAFVFKQTDSGTVIGSIITGMFAANYLGPGAAHYLGAWFGDGGTAFIVGVSAMVIIQGIVAAVRSKLGTVAKEKGTP